MSGKKYVPQGVYLACDKGTTPTEFKITNNSNSFLFDEPVATNGDIAPNVNILSFGSCSVKNGSPCMPVPTAWQGFEDGIFIGNFAPLLEDSVMPCGVGGKIEIFYSLEEAQAACAEDSGGFWSTLGKVALVVAAVALIVVTGGMAVAAIGAVAAASGALATGVAVTVAALEVAGVALTVKALYDYSQDGDEEALFKEVALGFLFLGAGKALEKGFRMWRGAKNIDEVFDYTQYQMKQGEKLGDFGEDVAESYYRSAGYDEFYAVQNKSGNGVDIVGRNSDNGNIVKTEVKTTQQDRLYNNGDPKEIPMSKDQKAMGGEKYTNDRLNRAAKREDGYTDGVSSEQAKEALKAQRQALKNGAEVKTQKMDIYVDQNGNLRCNPVIRNW